MRKILVQVGVFQGAEQKPKSVLQKKIERGRYGMFRLNVLGSEVKLYFTLLCR